MLKGDQPFLFPWAESELDALAIIMFAECGIEVRTRRNQFVESLQILIQLRAQTIGDHLWRRDAWPNQPKRIDEWKTGESVPGFAQVPVAKACTMFLPKADRLIADDQATSISRDQMLLRLG